MKKYLFTSVALILLGCQEDQMDQVGMIPAMAQEAQNPVVNDSVFSEPEPEPDSSYILFQMADEAMKKSELKVEQTQLEQEREESIELGQGEVSFEKEILQAETSDEELVSDEQEDVAPKKVELFAQVLEHVGKNGKVNYIGVKSQLETLNAFLLACSVNEPSNEAPKNERLAFYINLYNAAVLYKVALNYPLKSINDLKDPWNDPFIQLSGKSISLSYLENEIIKKEFILCIKYVFD